MIDLRETWHHPCTFHLSSCKMIDASIDAFLILFTAFRVWQELFKHPDFDQKFDKFLRPQ